MLGDLLVRVPSASGEADSRVTDVVFHIGWKLQGLHHLALLDHPDVYRQLVASSASGRATCRAPEPVRRLAGHAGLASFGI